jgi:imidazolonepropionase-like amidohydrolase
MKITTVKINVILFVALMSAVPLRGFAQLEPVIISGATIHTGNGQVIENGFLGFVSGKIFLCADRMDATYKNARVIEARGKHVYPGLICLNTFVGLNEIDAVRATRDYNEVGELNPNVRALIAYNTDSRVTPTLLSNGILLAQIVPQGGLISGSSSVMKTAGWNWEDAAYKVDDGLHMNWPELSMRGVPPEKEKEVTEKMERKLAAIDELFMQAFAYARTANPKPVNTRFEAMKNIFNGKASLYLHVNSAKGIISCLSFVKHYPGIKAVLAGAADAYLLTDLIQSSGVPVILNSLHRLPSRAYEAVDQPYALPSILSKAGIEVAIGHFGSWESRNLMFSAGTAAAYGWTKEEALKAITLTPANILGIGRQTGSLELGKDATLVISSGDILDMRTSIIEHAFINGAETDLDNAQKQLYRKFSKKYGK